MEFFTTVDFVVCMVVGVGVGLLAGQFMPGKGYGLVGNSLIGLAGGVISGWAFDYLDFMDIGDLLDPIIAGVVGAVILLAIAGVIRR